MRRSEPLRAGLCAPSDGTPPNVGRVGSASYKLCAQTLRTGTNSICRVGVGVAGALLVLPLYYANTV